MAIHTAQCDCGQASLAIDGEPRFVNACACRKCQRQGSGPIGIGVFFPEQALVEKTGTLQAYARKTDNGNDAVRYFCPQCGSALYWHTTGVPGHIGVSWGALNNPELFAPNWLVWARSLPSWVCLDDIKRYETQPAS